MAGPPLSPRTCHERRAPVPRGVAGPWLWAAALTCPLCLSDPIRPPRCPVTPHQCRGEERPRRCWPGVLAAAPAPDVPWQRGGRADVPCHRHRGWQTRQALTRRQPRSWGRGCGWHGHGCSTTGTPCCPCTAIPCPCKPGLPLRCRDLGSHKCWVQAGPGQDYNFPCCSGCWVTLFWRVPPPSCHPLTCPAVSQLLGPVPPHCVCWEQPHLSCGVQLDPS